MLSKPYLRQIEKIDEFTVYEVDGQYIRNNVNREFTNFGQHYRFPFIPKYEFWLDKEYAPGEGNYFIDHLIIEWNLMDAGVSYDDALGKADVVEKKERLKHELLTTVKEKVTNLFGIVPREVYVGNLGKFGDVDVCIVNGEVVRNLFFIDFTEGGHHFVYDFVPLHEVWLDNDLNPIEMDYVLLHELHERYLMSQGYDYSAAHRSSSIIEYKCRRDPKKLDECLNAEVLKNKSLVEV